MDPRKRLQLSSLVGAPPGAGVDPTGADPTAAGAPSTDQVSTPALAALQGPGVDASQALPPDAQVEQILPLLSDPNTPPDQKAMLQAQLALAARRRMAGVAANGATP